MNLTHELCVLFYCKGFYIYMCNKIFELIQLYSVYKKYSLLYKDILKEHIIRPIWYGPYRLDHMIWSISHGTVISKGILLSYGIVSFRSWPVYKIDHMILSISYWPYNLYGHHLYDISDDDAISFYRSRWIGENTISQ